LSDAPVAHINVVNRRWVAGVWCRRSGDGGFGCSNEADAEKIRIVKASGKTGAGTKIDMGGRISLETLAHLRTAQTLQLSWLV
jgi:Ni,Fe-hydrogenase I small subunit